MGLELRPAGSFSICSSPGGSAPRRRSEVWIWRHIAPGNRFVNLSYLPRGCLLTPTSVDRKHVTDTLWRRRSTEVAASSEAAGSGVNADCFGFFFAVSWPVRWGIPAMWLVSHLVFGILGDYRRRSGSATWQWLRPFFFFSTSSYWDTVVFSSIEPKAALLFSFMPFKNGFTPKVAAFKYNPWTFAFWLLPSSPSVTFWCGKRREKSKSD